MTLVFFTTFLISIIFVLIFSSFPVNSGRFESLKPNPSSSESIPPVFIHVLLTVFSCTLVNLFILYLHPFLFLIAVYLSSLLPYVINLLFSLLTYSQPLVSKRINNSSGGPSKPPGEEWPFQPENYTPPFNPDGLTPERVSRIRTRMLRNVPQDYELFGDLSYRANTVTTWQVRLGSYSPASIRIINNVVYRPEVFNNIETCDLIRSRFQSEHNQLWSDYVNSFSSSSTSAGPSSNK